MVYHFILKRCLNHMSKLVLVIMAHPDDEVLACGGTIAKHSANGDRVVVAILGEGKASRQNEKNALKIRRDIQMLRKESTEANRILGVLEVIYKDFPDNAIDSIPLLNVIQYIEELKRKYRPDIVYTHNVSDLNIDHQLIFKAVLTAFRPIKNDYVPFIYACEVPSATEWQAPNTGLGFQPNVFVDICDTLEIKKRALAAYSSELREYPHPRSIEAIDVIGKRWGIMVGFEAAEPFILVRNVAKWSKGVMPFILRDAVEDDRDDILIWRNDPLAREMSERRDIISDKEHALWYKKKIAGSQCRIYIAIGDMEKKLGMIRFDIQSIKSHARISINIDPEYRGRGLGRELLQRGIESYLCENRNIQYIDAIIKKENVVSERIFRKAGFNTQSSATIKGFFKLTYIRD